MPAVAAVALVLLGIAVILFASSVKIVQEYERGVSSGSDGPRARRDRACSS